MAETIIATLRVVQAAPVHGQRITLFQDEDVGFWDEQGEAFTCIIGFEAALSVA